MGFIQSLIGLEIFKQTGIPVTKEIYQWFETDEDRARFPLPGYRKYYGDKEKFDSPNWKTWFKRLLRGQHLKCGGEYKISAAGLLTEYRRCQNCGRVKVIKLC